VLLSPLHELNLRNRHLSSPSPVPARMVPAGVCGVRNASSYWWWYSSH